MDFNNKTILITGLVIGGLLCVYVKNTELASVIFGGLIGYLSKDKVSIDPVVSDEVSVVEEVSPVDDDEVA